MAKKKLSTVRTIEAVKTIGGQEYTKKFSEKDLDQIGQKDGTYDGWQLVSDKGLPKVPGGVKPKAQGKGKKVDSPENNESENDNLENDKE